MSTYTQAALWTEPAPDTLELSFSWADGDTSQEQLERLATLVRSNIQVFRDENKRGHCVKVLSTRIEDGRLWGTCEEVWPWGKPSGAQEVTDEEEDEDC